MKYFILLLAAVLMVSCSTGYNEYEATGTIRDGSGHISGQGRSGPMCGTPLISK